MGWATKAMAATPKALECGCRLRTSLPGEKEIIAYCDEHWRALLPEEQRQFLRRERFVVAFTMAVFAAIVVGLISAIVLLIRWV